MSKENTAPSTALWSELFHVALYKPTQGRTTRQVTGFTLAIIVCVGAWRLYSLGLVPDTFTLGGGAQGGLDIPLRFPVSVLLAVVGSWIAYRVVNWPQFADFLIGVEAEMNKVSWPGWTELKRSSIVVIVLIFGLTAVLYAYDIIWYVLLRYVLGVIMA
jgi:preprotein translocase subunit SecE